MYLENDVVAVFGLVQMNDWTEIIFALTACVGCRIGADNQVTISIVAARRSNGFHKTFGIAVDGIISRLGNFLVVAI